MKLTIIDISTKAVTTKYGPKTMISLKTLEYPDKYVSGFQNPQNRDWQKGMEVEVETVTETEKNGKKYLNFSMPKFQQNGNGGLSIEDRKMLNDILFNTQEILKKLAPAHPGDEVNPDDIPF